MVRSGSSQATKLRAAHSTDYIHTTGSRTCNFMYLLAQQELNYTALSHVILDTACCQKKLSSVSLRADLTTKSDESCKSAEIEPFSVISPSGAYVSRVLNIRVSRDGVHHIII